MKNEIHLFENAKLRFLKESDAEELFLLIDSNREYLNKFLEWPRNTRSIDDIKKFIKITEKQKLEGICIYGIFFKNKIAGVVSYNSFDKQNKRAPIGYWLAEDQQGKGLVIKSVEALVNYGLKEMGLNRIEINCAVDNFPSQKVAQRLGFKKEGVARSAEVIGGKTIDHFTYSLIKEEWRKELF